MVKIDIDDAKIWVTTAVVHHAHDLTSALASRYGTGRSAASAAIKKLEEAGLIKRTGAVNRPVFEAGSNLTLMHSYSLPGIDARQIWQQDFAPFLARSLSATQHKLLEKAFTVVADNASLHSQGNSLHVVLEQDADHIELTLQDNGLGIFKRICQVKKLRDMGLAVDALTSLAAKKPGKGVAMIEKEFDFFLIEANGMHYPEHAAPALLSEPEEELFEQGTTVIMELTLNH